MIINKPNHSEKKSRMTAQKLKIIQFLEKTRTHPSAEEVYEAIKKDLPTISLATVYRNLNALAKEGRIRRFDLQGEARFEGDLCAHCHGICERCGRVFDFPDKELSDYALRRLKADFFIANCVGITYRGYCKGCKGG